MRVRACLHTIASACLTLASYVCTHVFVATVAHVRKCNDEGRALMMRDVKVLQAALDNLLRRNLLPSSTLSLSYAQTYVAALCLPPEQVCETDFTRWCLAD